MLESESAGKKFFSYIYSNNTTNQQRIDYFNNYKASTRSIWFYIKYVMLKKKKNNA